MPEREAPRWLLVDIICQPLKHHMVYRQKINCDCPYSDAAMLALTNRKCSGCFLFIPPVILTQYNSANCFTHWLACLSLGGALCLTEIKAFYPSGWCIVRGNALNCIWTHSTRGNTQSIKVEHLRADGNNPPITALIEFIKKTFPRLEETTGTFTGWINRYS